MFCNKNDYTCDGQQVVLQPSTEAVMCLVHTLEQYIAVMDAQLGSEDCPSHPVFLTLQKPFQALTAAGVATVMNRALQLAGLDGHTAKSFRPMGATQAVDVGENPDTVWAVGWWKDRNCFEFHYVHSQPHAGFTDSVLGTQPKSSIL